MDEDCSSEIPIRWEKDGPEIKEAGGAELKEMFAGPPPVEIGDNRSIRREEASPLSPISIMTRNTSMTLGSEMGDIVSPLSPK